REAAQRLIDEVSAEEMIDLLPEARRRALLHSYTLRTRRTLLANDLTADERVAALQDCLASERTESGILRARVSVLENALAAYFAAYEEKGWVSVEAGSASKWILRSSRRSATGMASPINRGRCHLRCRCPSGGLRFPLHADTAYASGLARESFRGLTGELGHEASGLIPTF